MADLTDDDLVELARGGDRTALEELLRANQDRIHAVCRRMLGNDADALDVTQDAMIAVVRGITRFDGRSAFSTWVYRVTTNACLDELRRRGRRPVVASLDEQRDGRAVREPVDTAPLPDDAVAGSMDVDAALELLQVDFRAAVVLRDLCQLDYAEISEVLHIPPGTVRSRIARGRATLAEALRAGNRPTGDERPSHEQR